MKRRNFRDLIPALSLFLLTLSLASIAAPQDMQVRGLVILRNATTMTVKTEDSESFVVVLRPDTQVEQAGSLLRMPKKELGPAALIPGLRVQVRGTMNDRHELVADWVKFNGSDLKTAQAIQAGLTTTEQQIATNQSQIQTNQERIQAQRQQIAANAKQIEADQQEIAANKAAAATANKRLGQLGDYSVVGELTIYFSNGTAALEPPYKLRLQELAKKATSVDGYIIQVQGYASAVGPAALNQTLSMRRAETVLAFLQQYCGIPLTNILAPGGMGIAQPVASNATAEGQAANRRVVVRILQNKGIAGVL